MVDPGQRFKRLVLETGEGDLAKIARRDQTALVEVERYDGEPPAISRVVLRYGGSGLTELLSGNVDIATRVTPVEAMRLAADPRFRIYYKDERLQIAIAWNHQNPLFQDVDVRRALTMSIDRRELHRRA